MVKKLFNKVVKQAEVMSLKIKLSQILRNISQLKFKAKTLYIDKRTRRDRTEQNVTLKKYNFERATSFRYLTIPISEENSIFGSGTGVGLGHLPRKTGRIIVQPRFTKCCIATEEEVSIFVKFYSTTSC